jgi:hypothetical protein
MWSNRKWHKGSPLTNPARRHLLLRIKSNPLIISTPEGSERPLRLSNPRTPLQATDHLLGEVR